MSLFCRYRARPCETHAARPFDLEGVYMKRSTGLIRCRSNDGADFLAEVKGYEFTVKNGTDRENFIVHRMIDNSKRWVVSDCTYTGLRVSACSYETRDEAVDEFIRADVRGKFFRMLTDYQGTGVHGRYFARLMREYRQLRKDYERGSE